MYHCNTEQGKKVYLGGDEWLGILTTVAILPFGGAILLQVQKQP